MLASSFHYETNWECPYLTCFRPNNENLMSEKEFCTQIERLEETAEHIHQTLAQLEAKLEPLLLHPPPSSSPLRMSHSICGMPVSKSSESYKINKSEEIEKKADSANTSQNPKKLSKKSYFQTWYNVIFKTIRNHPYRFLPTPRRPLKEYLKTKLYSALNLH